MKKKTKVLIIIYIAVIMCFAAVIYLVPSVTGMLRPTDILTYGSITETDHETCYFIRDEKVYMAATGGDINYYFKDGEKVRKNTTILTISGNGGDPADDKRSGYDDIITKLGSSAVVKTDCMSEFNGIVSYYADGYEGYFTPETMHELDQEKVRKLDIDKAAALTRKSTMADEPLYKICRNEKWYITCWVEGGNISKYEKGDLVKFLLPEGELEAVVSDITDCGDNWQIIFRTTRYYEDFACIRKAETDIVTSDCQGIIIQNRSIATSDGQPGVYVKQKTGDYKFVPVKIYASDGERSAVAETFFYDESGQMINTVGIYDEILKDPE